MENFWNILTPVLILAATFACDFIFKRVLGKLLRLRHLTRFEPLARPASSLLYVIGAQLAVDNTILPAKAALWAGHGIFVLGVILALRLLRTAALIGIEWTTSLGGEVKEALGPLQEGFVPMLRNVLNLFIFFAGTIMVLKNFGYDVMSLLAALGVGSLAVGLAAKDTLSNMISGFTLMLDRNLVPGDLITIGGTTGKVEEIGLRSTKILTRTGSVLIVPNAEIVNTRILNLSHPQSSVVVSTTLKLALDADAQKATALCQAALEGLPGRLADRPAWVNLSSLSDAALTLQAGFWTESSQSETDVLSEFHHRVLRSFRAHQIPLAGTPAPAPTPSADKL